MMLPTYLEFIISHPSYKRILFQLQTLKRKLMEFLSFCSVIYVATKKAFCIFFFFIFKPTMFIQATLTYHKAPWTSTSMTTTILPPILGLSLVEENLFRGCRNGLLWRRKSLPGIPNSPYGCPIQDSPHNESLALDTQACALAAKWPFYAPSAVDCYCGSAITASHSSGAPHRPSPSSTT